MNNGLSVDTMSLEEDMPKDKYAETKYRWKQENTKIFTTRLSKVSEQKMIDWLENHRPTNAYIKGLIREDMNKK